MADYKDYVDSVLNKAKDIATSEAGTVEKLKGAVQSTGISEVFAKGTQRAKSFGNATKLTIDLNRDHKELERVFAEIGKLYYEQTKGTPEGFFSPLFEQVEALHEAISLKETEIEAYKASFESSNPAASSEAASEPDLDTRIDDFEAIVNRTETDGSST